MNQLQLTEAQKLLLLRLVEYRQNDQISDYIVAIPAGPSEYVIHIQDAESLRIVHLSDLDALCAADLLGYRLNRMGNGKIYHLTKATLKAIPNVADLPAPLTELPENWQTLINIEQASTYELRRRAIALQTDIRRTLSATLPAELVPNAFDLVRQILAELHSGSPDADRIASAFQGLLAELIAAFALPNAQRASLAQLLLGGWGRIIFAWLERVY